MKKSLIIAFAIALLLVFPACEKKEPSLYEQAVVEAAKTDVNPSDKKENSQSLFEWLGYEGFEIKRELNKSDRATAKIINHSTYTLEGNIALVVYDENNAILDTQYVSLPKVGLKPDETFVVDEIIRKEKYHTVKFADADMLRQK